MYGTHASGIINEQNTGLVIHNGTSHVEQEDNVFTWS